MTHFTKTNAPNHTDEERRIMNEAVDVQLGKVNICDMVDPCEWCADVYETICADVLRGMEKEAVT